MDRRQAVAAKGRELAPLLQRRFWQPLRSMMQVFHVLPLAAAVILFVFLATEGQFQELYISYLEGPRGGVAGWLASLVAALAILALLSAVLCEAHFSLSTMRINVVYSSYSNPDAHSRLRSLQRSAAFGLAFFPWLGVAIGLFNARNFVADRYCQLLSQMPADELERMQHLLLPGGWTIAAAIIFLGAAATTFSCIDQKTRIAQRTVALLAPPLGALLFLLFTDWLMPSIKDWWALIFCACTLLATAVYFGVYQWLYGRRGRPVFSRPAVGAPEDSSLAPLVDVPQNRQELLLAWALAPLRLVFARPEFSTGTSLRKHRRRTFIVWAFLPWLLFALYFAIVPYFAPSAQAAEAWWQSQCPIAATLVPVPGHWTIFPVAMCCAIGVGLLVGLVLNSLSEQWMWRRIAILSGIGALAVGAKAVSLFDVETIVAIYRFVGPLGTVGMQLLFLTSTFALLAWLSQRSGFPALTLVILAMVVCVMFPSYVGVSVVALGIVCIIFAGLAFVSRLRAVGCVALIVPVLGIVQWYELRPARVMQNPVPPNSAIDPLSVKFEFECWLGQRGISIQDAGAADQLKQRCPARTLQGATSVARAGTAHKYPVFIIAAEGGGIYAASAASMFLARLQETSPHFGEHVFAISGVSGGAIGSTIYQVLDKAGAAPPQGGTLTQETLTQEVSDVMEDDHFSPVVGSIFPEILGASTGRAEALVASFRLSTAARNGAAGRELAEPFAQHWTPDAGAPALVLNATWVETGYRVAFAPFHLHDVNESLYSFSDASMPDEDCPRIADQQSCISLMEAAAVSARFPLVLPPFSVQMRDGKRWNFVDGGYTDNSGATTALDLYEKLKDVAPHDVVDLTIVLITSSTPQPDLSGTDISGTAFRDTLAPIDALMKVRADLGNDAVARACSAIYPEDANQPKRFVHVDNNADPRPRTRQTESNGSCIEHAGQPGKALQIVEIQDQTYGLSLGWKISQTSFSVVSWMLGDPQKCRRSPAIVTTTQPQNSAEQAPAEPSNNLQLNDQIVAKNSCVMKSIVDALGS